MSNKQLKIRNKKNKSLAFSCIANCSLCIPKRFLFFTLTLLIFNSSLLFADFGFRLMPSFNVPLGKEYFNSGFGGVAALDWAFLHLERKFSFGLSAMGGMASFPVEESDSFSILEGGIGPFALWRLNDRFSLRLDTAIGVYKYSWESESNTKLFAGGALSGQYHLTPFISLFAEVGYFWHMFSDTQPINNLRSGAGVALNISELIRPQSRLKGEKTEQYLVFPVNFAWYEDNALAMMKITNEENNTITDIRFSFLLERYMNQPSLFASVESLKPGETLEIPVKALFNESMLDLTEGLVASARIIADYKSLGTGKTALFQIQMPVYSRNSLTWDDDRRAASFVSPRDPASVYFARYVSSAITKTASQNVPENVRLAAALFEALRLYGITYIIDPASSYIALSEDAATPDTLNYPYETLLYRGGDCDDLSILFSAMLETLGIQSAFITIPGHIYAAFEIGDEAWRKGHADIIEHGGKRWLPVEITVPDRGFSEACRIGARQWKGSGKEGQLYPMHENWKIYPPVSVNSAGDSMPSMPERKAIAAALEAELRKMK